MGAENLPPTRIRSPDRPVRSESLYRLRHPDPICTEVYLMKLLYKRLLLLLELVSYCLVPKGSMVTSSFFFFCQLLPLLILLPDTLPFYVNALAPKPDHPCLPACFLIHYHFVWVSLSNQASPCISLNPKFLPFVFFPCSSFFLCYISPNM